MMQIHSLHGDKKVLGRRVLLFQRTTRPMSSVVVVVVVSADWERVYHPSFESGPRSVCCWIRIYPPYTDTPLHNLSQTHPIRMKVGWSPMLKGVVGEVWWKVMSCVLGEWMARVYPFGRILLTACVFGSMWREKVLALSLPNISYPIYPSRIFLFFSVS
jgi:hypothetical protein